MGDVIHIQTFKPDVPLVPLVPGAAGDVAYYTRIREKGDWVKGVWTVETSEACTHRHRTADAAKECMRVRWTYEPVGQVIEVRTDGTHHIIEHLKPARYREATATSGRVEVIARTWYALDEIPDPKRPVELVFVVGDYEARFWALNRHDVRQVEGMALALRVMLVDLPVDRVVAIWHAMQREPELPENVTRLR